MKKPCSWWVSSSKIISLLKKEKTLNLSLTSVWDKTCWEKRVSVSVYVVLHHTTHPDNKDPLNKRQTKARNGPISSCSWSSQTERQEKSNPVEEEWHWESRRKAAGQDTFIFQDKKNINPLHSGFSWCYININVTQTILGHCLQRSSFHQVLTEESQHENAIIPYPQLVSVIKVIPGHKVIILQCRGGSTWGI